MNVPLLTTLDGKQLYDTDTAFVIKEPISYGEIIEMKILDNVFDLYKNKGYYFFGDKRNALSFMSKIKCPTMFLEFKNPIPVIVEGDKEGYAIYVRDGSTWENDIWAIVHCDGGIVRHYRSDQICVHQNQTYGIKKKE